MVGYWEAEDEQNKYISELIRTSTAILWNIQVGIEDKATPEELWPLPWDKPIERKAEIISPEEMARRENESKKYLQNKFPDTV
jgi:hypothetical protein